MKKHASSTTLARVGSWIVSGLLLPGALVAQSSAADTAGSPPIATQVAGRPALQLGVAWYPEQWPESRWDDDLQMMEAAHVTVVRIAEFAWSTMEPADGRFELDWLERAVRLAGKHRLAVVLGTPSAAPPAWLTAKHPETLRMETDGRRVSHGGRAHGSPTSALYRRYRMRIAERMARRFGHDPNVIGWQIGNEFGYALMSHDDDARRQFQGWLKEKYGALDELNRRWTTAYWSQTYGDWSEIPIPVGGQSPGLLLGWKRFVTKVWNDEQKDEIEVVRRHADARQFTTGNFLGSGFDGFDHYTVAEPLTFASWSSYVPTGHVDPAQNGLAHDLIRGLKRQNFWVMETQPGHVNWSRLNTALDKGEVRAMAWQAIGRGADAVAYWQWRGALNGQEQYHGSLVGPDGAPRPILDEVRQVGQEFAQVESALRGTSVVSRVALLNDYESRWAIEWQEHHEAYDQMTLLGRYYRTLRKNAESIDVVSPHAPLANYALVVAPSLNVIPEALATHLLDYVRGGGHLVLGPRAGMKDEHNALLPQRQPGLLVPALGGRVEEFYALEKGVPAEGAWGTGEVRVWAEWLAPSQPDVAVLLRYGRANGWLDGQPAVLTRKVGNGRITYVGAVLDDTLLGAASEWMLRESGVASDLGPLPEGIDVGRRVDQDRQVFVVANFAGQRRQVPLRRAMRSLLDGKNTDNLDLAPYDVAVLAPVEGTEAQ